MPCGQWPISMPSSREAARASQRWPASRACHDPSMLIHPAAVAGPDPTFNLGPGGAAAAATTACALLAIIRHQCRHPGDVLGGGDLRARPRRGLWKRVANRLPFPVHLEAGRQQDVDAQAARGEESIAPE